MRATLLNEAGLCVNVIALGEGYESDQGLVIGPSDGQIGWTWNGVEWIKPEPPPPPPPTTEDVRAEAQRRIIALVGAKDLNSCMVKQLNANMRANELNDIQHSRELTTEEAAEAQVLRSLAIQIKAIRAASNVLEPNPPQDYTDDKYWP